MKPHTSIMVVTGLRFLFTLFFGVWLGRNLGLNDRRLFGESVTVRYPQSISSSHLSMVISAGVTIGNLLRGREFRSFELAPVIVAVIASLLSLLMIAFCG
jgi:hypothetical protein